MSYSLQGIGLLGIIVLEHLEGYRREIPFIINTEFERSMIKLIREIIFLLDIFNQPNCMLKRRFNLFNARNSRR